MFKLRPICMPADLKNCELFIFFLFTLDICFQRVVAKKARGLCLSYSCMIV